MSRAERYRWSALVNGRRVQTAAFALEPAVRLRDVAFIQALQQRMKLARVVEVDEVRDFMGNDRAAHRVGRHDQPPVDPYGALAGT